MYLMGDLNCDMLKKEKLSNNMPTKKLNSVYELYQLSQLIDEATRITMTTSIALLTILLPILLKKFLILVLFTPESAITV